MSDWHRKYQNLQSVKMAPKFNFKFLKNKVWLFWVSRITLNWDKKPVQIFGLSLCFKAKLCFCSQHDKRTVFLRLLSLWSKLFSSYIEFKVWSLSTTALIWTPASNFYHARDSVKKMSFSRKFSNIVNRENYKQAFVLTKKLLKK